MTEVTSHSVIIADHGKVTIDLEGLCKTDMYGTNLELTGHGNWFGSMNMCNMLGDSYDRLFSPGDDSEPASVSIHMLELGSGLGRAGLMALKRMEIIRHKHDCAFHCTLTDGESEIVEMLQKNYERNFPVGFSDCVCQQLWWGDKEQMDKLLKAQPGGFDIIIGADLIYGRDAIATVDKVEACGESCDNISADTGGAEGQGGFGRDKLNAILLTVNFLLSKRNCRTSYPDCSSGGVDSSGVIPYAEIGAFDVQRRPSFYLAVTRRELLPLEELRSQAAMHDLGVSVLEDYAIDIFDQSVDVESMFWRDAILHFYRI